MVPAVPQVRIVLASVRSQINTPVPDRIVESDCACPWPVKIGNVHRTAMSFHLRDVPAADRRAAYHRIWRLQ